MKNLKYVLFAFIINFTVINQVYALDLDNFCQGSVQGVFTALGWLFFIVKILVPIILIVLGCIDFAKAVVGGKPDDEVKKSMQRLALRAIAGVVIFLIPSLLSLVVDVIDAGSLYDKEKGTFADCTRCMLDPANSCASMGGE